MRIVRLILTLFSAVLLLSCQKREGEELGKSISIATGISSVKTTLDGDVLVWENGDAVAVFNDASRSIEKMLVGLDGKGVARIPEVAKNITVVYPYGDSKTPEVLQYQRQKQGGVFPGANFPLVGSAPVGDTPEIKVQLECVASCVAFTISGLPQKRAVQHIKITFPTWDANYAVSLDNPVFGGSGEKIYLVLEKEHYPQALIDIYTDGEVYRLTTKGKKSFDCTLADILETTVDISSGKIVVSSLDRQNDISGTVEKFDGSFSEISFEDSNVDRIPDFSRVGYHYGDSPIPTLPVKATISLRSVSEALSSGEYKDTTSYIQSVIDAVGNNGGGAVLLKNGTYNVSGTLFVDKSGVVLRGESQNKTIIKNTGTVQRPVIYLGRSSDRALNAAGDTPLTPSRSVVTYGTAIIEDYVPVGREYVRVANPSLFTVGESVVIYRPKTLEWISDIGMDKIPDIKTTEEYDVTQWQYRKRDMYWERKIVSVCGDCLYLDAPIVMALDKNYGGGSIYKLSYSRVSESGIENIGIDCIFDASITHDYGGGKKGGLQYEDEKHAKNAILVAAADNCWVRRVTSTHMNLSLAYLGDYAIRVTVEDCTSKDPVSIVSGGRRYAYLLAQSELCLVKNCTCDNDRHGCCTSGHGTPGPNVYYACTGTNMHDAMGVHMAWSTGTLLDNIHTDGIIAVEDRGYSGNGHGWSGANTVFWNIEVGNDRTKSYVTCQSPWAKENTPSLEFHSPFASGRNYAIGVKGLRREYDQPNVVNALSKYGVPDYYYNVMGVDRPSGVWYPEVAIDSQGSLHVSVFDETGKGFAWWPRMTISSSTNPLSLYQSQLEDRHSRGIYLNNL